MIDWLKKLVSDAMEKPEVCPWCHHQSFAVNKAYTMGICTTCGAEGIYEVGGWKERKSLPENV